MLHSVSLRHYVNAGHLCLKRHFSLDHDPLWRCHKSPHEWLNLSRLRGADFRVEPMLEAYGHIIRTISRACDLSRTCGCVFCLYSGGVLSGSAQERA